MPIELISSDEVDGIRADAEQLFVDTVQITRLKDLGVLQADGTYSGPYEEIILEAVQSGGEWVPNASIYPVMSRRDRFDEFGAGLIFTRQYRVDLRWDTADVQIRDQVTVIASRDPQMLGRSFEARDVVVGTNLGYRRVTVHDSRE